VTVKEYVPFDSVNVIVLVDVVCRVVPNVTDHEPPVGKPDAVNVTVYVGTEVNTTLCSTFSPLTVIVPLDGVALNPVGGWIENE
jgi:hypothetical protein